MKKQGFATSGILYTILLLFIALLFGVLQNLQNKKTILDQLKIETINALSCDCIKINDDINTLKAQHNQIGVVKQWNGILTVEAGKQVQTFEPFLIEENGVYLVSLNIIDLDDNLYVYITKGDKSVRIKPIGGSVEINKVLDLSNIIEPFPFSFQIINSSGKTLNSVGYGADVVRLK